MSHSISNLFAPVEGAGEIFEPLLAGAAFRLERIVSQAQPSPPGFWYEQAEAEWVALLRGEAVLVFADGETLNLRAGDALCIEAGCRHRVESCSRDAVWLALHHARAMSAAP